MHRYVIDHQIETLVTLYLVTLYFTMSLLHMHNLLLLVVT